MYCLLIGARKMICFGLVLGHINHCTLFNVKSIFISKTVLFQTIQLSISALFKCHKQFYFKQYSLT